MTDPVYVSVSVCFCTTHILSLCMSECLSVYMSECLSLCTSECLSVSPSVSLSVYISECLSLCTSKCLSLHLYVCLYVCLNVYLYVSLSVCLISMRVQHIFCEDCVATWFSRERTCPMCRANIVDTPQWRDGATSTSFQVY